METPSAIVTGGSSGIGAATAKVLSDRGYRVTIIGRNQDRLREVSSKLLNVTWMEADLSSPSHCRGVIIEACENAGRLDLLVNGAGILGPTVPISELSDADWDAVIGTNLRGPIAATTAAVPFLREFRGSVVNIASINAIQAEPNLAPYGVTKAALVGFTKFAAADLAKHGIRVNAVLPGWVSTPMISNEIAAAGLLDDSISTNLLGRLAHPEEIARVIAFLASPDASYLTGECIVADGGHVIYSRDFAPTPAGDEVGL